MTDAARPGLFRSALLPLRDCFRLRGRSTRSEVLGFWLLCAIIGALSRALSWEVLWPPAVWRMLGSILVGVPWFTLFVRRAHDQGHSGWWAAGLTGALFALDGLLALGPQSAEGGMTVSDLLWTFHPTGPIASALFWVGSAVVLAILVLFFLPETPGPNRYGPDPRDPDPVPAAASA